MQATEAYSRLSSSGRPAITTAEAASRLGCSTRAAGKRLLTLERAGLIARARRALWLLDPQLPSGALAPYLTAPHPAYVSTISALAFHDITEQIPQTINIVSTDRSRVINTAVGSFHIHHITPELFGGYSGTPQTGYVASPEKALFDAVYLKAAAGSRAYFPELDLPPDLDRPEIDCWIDRISSKRLKTMVTERLTALLETKR